MLMLRSSPIACQAASCSMPCCSTHLPTAVPKPVCSIRGRKLAGSNRPCSGWFQRNSASTPAMRPVAAPLAGTYFNYRKTTIYGGSNEVQRNIVAQTVLG